jgi:hypothetical protein
MLADQFLEAASAARTTHALDQLSRLTWRAHAEGQLNDAEGQAISEALQARRASFSVRIGGPATKAAPGLPPAKRPPRSPDRQASLERRRRQATSGAVPAKIAASFTPGETAVLSVIARQCQRAGACVLPIDAIAALAGVGRTTTQNAMRQARKLGLILVKERRIPGRKSLTNVVRVISRDWSGWLKLGGRTIGFRKLSPTDSLLLSKGNAQASCHTISPWAGQASCHTISPWAGRLRS